MKYTDSPIYDKSTSICALADHRKFGHQDFAAAILAMSGHLDPEVYFWKKPSVLEWRLQAQKPFSAGRLWARRSGSRYGVNRSLFSIYLVVGDWKMVLVVINTGDKYGKIWGIGGLWNWWGGNTCCREAPFGKCRTVEGTWRGSLWTQIDGEPRYKAFVGLRFIPQITSSWEHLDCRDHSSSTSVSYTKKKIMMLTNGTNAAVW